MGPLSELAVPLKPVHPNPVSNLAGTRHSDRMSPFYRYGAMGGTGPQLYRNSVTSWVPKNVPPASA